MDTLYSILFSDGTSSEVTTRREVLRQVADRFNANAGWLDQVETATGFVVKDEAGIRQLAVCELL